MTQERGSVGYTFESFLADEGFKEEVCETAKKAGGCLADPEAKGRRKTSV